MLASCKEQSRNDQVGGLDVWRQSFLAEDERGEIVEAQAGLQRQVEVYQQQKRMQRALPRSKRDKRSLKK